MRGARVKALRSTAGFTHRQLRSITHAKRAFRDLKEAYQAEGQHQDSPDRGPNVPAIGQQARYLGSRHPHWHQRRVIDPTPPDAAALNFHYEDCAIYVRHPLKNVGEFFLELDEVGQTHAMQLAEFAGRMPRHELNRHFWQLRNNGEITA